MELLLFFFLWKFLLLGVTEIALGGPSPPFASSWALSVSLSHQASLHLNLTAWGFPHHVHTVNLNFTPTSSLGLGPLLLLGDFSSPLPHPEQIFLKPLCAGGWQPYEGQGWASVPASSG